MMHEIKTMTIYFYNSFYNGYCLCHVPCVIFFLLFLFLFFFFVRTNFLSPGNYLQNSKLKKKTSERVAQNCLFMRVHVLRAYF